MPVAMIGERVSYPVDLDASHPSLDHHRPGGLPLFGTAMGIDTIAGFARQVFAPLVVVSIEAVAIHGPCIMADNTQRRLTVEFQAARPDEAPRSVLARLTDPARAGRQSVHFEARVRVGTTPRLQPDDRRTPRTIDAPGAVDADEIYRAYFHGPAFQVIANAGFDGDRVMSVLAPGTGLIPDTARILEFGLQSSGLLELALSGRMMVPHRIDRIDYAASGRVEAGCRIHAEARLHNGAGGGNDITIADDTGRLLMHIENYQTVPLPFASDLSAASDLGAKLRTRRFDVQAKNSRETGRPL